MRLPIESAFAIGLWLAIVASNASEAQTLPVTRISNGFTQPLFLTHAPTDANRLFVVEQGVSDSTGQIKIVDPQTGVVSPTPFLSVPNVGSGFEQGLLGLAFHPAYQDNGLFYVDYVDTNGDNQIFEYQRETADIARADSGRRILTIPQNQSNHNGGWIDFGPDNYLYIVTGDGGGGYDPNNNGQRRDTLTGSVLRIDVNEDGFPEDDARNYSVPASNPFVNQTGLDEIWAQGVRNAWRSSFDRETGDLYIADVGQRHREEITVQPAASTGGENYGWRLREGTIRTPSGGGDAPTAIDPIYDIDHAGGRRSLTGGYVYRGPEEGLHGNYFFADFLIDENAMHSLKWDGTDPAKNNGENYTHLTEWTLLPDEGNVSAVASFGEDLAGNLYIIDYGDGEIFRVEFGEADFRGDFNDDYAITGADMDLLSFTIREGNMTAGMDLNSDGIVDAADRAYWLSDIARTILGDANLDRKVAFGDFLTLSNSFGMQGGWAQGDFTGDGRITFPDFLTLSNHFGMSAPTAAPVPEPGSGPIVVMFGFGLIVARGRFRTHF